MNPIFSLCLLASGSKGNSIYVSDGETSVLIDSGFSGVEIERRMKTKGISPKTIDAILVSHEHSDHIHGVGILARRFDIPVYINPKTEEAGTGLLGKIPDIRHFTCGTSFAINGLTVHPFSIPHDTCDPAGFTFSRNGTKIGVATDLGVPTAVVKHHLSNCNALIIEANHDPDMLINGPYPWPLKQRIKSRTGHLSNADSGKLIKELTHDGLRHVILAHLSETNNTPEIALSEVMNYMAGERPKITVATQDSGTDMILV